METASSAGQLAASGTIVKLDKRGSGRAWFAGPGLGIPRPAPFRNTAPVPPWADGRHRKSQFLWASPGNPVCWTALRNAVSAWVRWPFSASATPRKFSTCAFSVEFCRLFQGFQRGCHSRLGKFNRPRTVRSKASLGVLRHAARIRPRRDFVLLHFNGGEDGQRYRVIGVMLQKFFGNQAGFIVLTTV